MNILVLSTYPSTPPTHGGQHRLLNIIEFYKKQGHKVSSAGVLGSDGYPKAEGFVSYPGLKALAGQIESSFLMEDWAIGKLFANNDKYFNLLLEKIDFCPDVIHVEQPWLFGFAVRYIKEKRLNKKTKLIYGSQNVESHLKKQILKNYLTLDAAEKGSGLVLETELFAIENADGVCCVSEEDLKWTKSQGVNKPCVLAPNGVTYREATVDGVYQANQITQNKKIALYCASAHPPNIHGFFEVFKAGAGCFSPEQRLVVVGGAGQAIMNDRRFAKVAGMSAHYVSAGVVSEECLQGLLSVAHTIILPIMQGGGTNLKTAEAIWAGKHIVATRAAMRGFETFIGANGISVANSSEEFLKQLRISMQSEPCHLSARDYQEREVVLMQSTLHSLGSLLDTIQ